MTNNSNVNVIPPRFCQVCGLVLPDNAAKVYWDKGWICSAKCRMKLTRQRKQIQPRD
jgi:hypothetical protein